MRMRMNIQEQQMKVKGILNNLGTDHTHNLCGGNKSKEASWLASSGMTLWRGVL
jgi:hypothetical protein